MSGRWWRPDMALQRLLRPAELHATKAAAVPVEEVKHSFDTGAHYSLATDNPPPPQHQQSST